ncbi:MAG TPA: polyphosphate kinase 1 [Mariprofundaceae bacterium]|nr:polyphosphate kinase 1 [Mariprofundaceae bacterium]
MSQDLQAPELYLNRNLSMLAFNQRVFELACDESVPLLERLRFLCISSSNLDEFFEVRVAMLKQRVAMGLNATSPDGLSTSETLNAIRTDVEALVEKQYALIENDILPAMRDEDIKILPRHEWNETQQQWLRRFFRAELLPVLTPIALDPAYPFPKLVNKILNFIVTLEGKDAFGRDVKKAIVQAPRSLPRLIALPDDVADCAHGFVLLSSIMHAYVDDLFPGMEVSQCHQFRVTRNSELYRREEESEDLKKMIAAELLDSRFGAAVRLEVSIRCPEELSDFLLHQFNLKEQDLYHVNGLVNLYRLAAISDEVDRADLKFKPFVAGLPTCLSTTSEDDSSSLFDRIKRSDVLLHHPFQSFEPVMDLLNQAANDPDVLAIKQTMYRVVPDSPIVNALVKAAANGKEVVAIIELRARFNEADNIGLADRLHAAGVQVIYGVVGYKTHGKMMLIVRREGRRLRRYVHLGTGNYHSITSRYYTDFGLLSCNPELAEDVHKMFQQLTGTGRVQRMKTLLHAPFTLHKGMLERIEREIGHVQAGGQGRIIGKMNGLEEPEMIQALYRASQAGVKIDLMVRGICCLRPGIKGVSENIRVRSILGRFLEHHRVYYFLNGGDEELFCASADWMSRNLLHRVETCFPILDKTLFDRVMKEGLRTYLADNTGTWNLRSDGRYVRIRSDAKPRSAQQELMDALGHMNAG